MDLTGRNVTVAEPHDVSGLPNEEQTLRAAPRRPSGTPALPDLVQADDTVAIVFSNIIRPQPLQRMSPTMLWEVFSLQEMLEPIHPYGYARQDQREAQVQAEIKLSAEVYVESTAGGAHDHPIPCRPGPAS